MSATSNPTPPVDLNVDLTTLGDISSTETPLPAAAASASLPVTDALPSEPPTEEERAGEALANPDGQATVAGPSVDEQKAEANRVEAVRKEQVRKEQVGRAQRNKVLAADSVAKIKDAMETLERINFPAMPSFSQVSNLWAVNRDSILEECARYCTRMDAIIEGKRGSGKQD